MILSIQCVNEKYTSININFRDQLNSQNPWKLHVIYRIFMKPQFMSFEYVLYIHMSFLFCCRWVGWVLHHQQSITTVVVCSLTCKVGQRNQTRYGGQTGGHAQRRRSSTENSTTCYSRSCQTCRSSASHPELVPEHPAYNSLWNGGIQK